MKWLLLGDIGRANLYHVGDEAMAEAAIDALQSRGDSDVRLIATDAQAATDLYGLSAVSRIGISADWATSRRDEALSAARSGDIEPATPLADLDAAVAATDAVLISGGGNMSTHYAHHIDERAVLTRLARRHDKPLVVAAQTIGPDLCRRDRNMLAEIIEYAIVFAVRDDQSYHLVLELGGDPAHVRRVSDDAILLTPSEEEQAAAAELVRPGTGYLVASFTSTPGNSGLDRHDYLDLVAATLDQLAQAHDADVLLIPHLASHFGPARKYDELSDASIVERSASGRIRALPAMTAGVATALTAGASLCVSTRYHPLVFGPAHGVPAIGLSLSQYSTVRMRGALEPVGLGGFLLGPTSWESVLPAAREIAGRQAEIREHLLTSAGIRRERQQAWWDHALATAGGVHEPRAPRLPAARECAPAGAGAPQSAERIHPHGAWAGPAARSLAQFDQLETSRRHGAELTAQLAQERRRTKKQEGELGQARQRAARLTTHANALTRRAERAEQRRAVRLMDSAGDAVRTLRALARPRGAHPPARRPDPSGVADRPDPHSASSVHTDAAPAAAASGAAPQPLLSVLIPIYNVADYLHACLASVVDQTLADMEIILIDDGSTDASAQIAQSFADADERIRLIRQENRGLGAVRNRGVRQARGKYLTFLDSDDVLPRHSLNSLLSPLEHSGADLSIGGTARLLPDGTYRTRQWVRDLHMRDRHTSLAQEPALLRDFFTWNKVYRTDFFRRHAFSFRTGVLFEDQPVVTEILCRAASIDVVAATTYHYRIRPDDSALTGRMHSLANIRARHQAIGQTKEALERIRPGPEIWQAWWWTLLEYHFPAYLTRAASATDDQYEAVVAMMRAVITPQDLPGVANVSAAHRVLCHLALTAERAAVQHYLAHGGGSTSQLPLENREAGIYARLPNPGGPENPVPEELGRIAGDEQRLVTILDGHSWTDPTTLMLAARVGLSQTMRPAEVRVRAFLATTGQRVGLPSTGHLLPPTDLPRPFGVPAWYSMQICIDVAALQQQCGDLLRRGARVELEVAWDEHSRSGVLSRRHQVPAALDLTGSVLPHTSTVAEVTWTRPAGLRLRLVPRPITATVLAGDGGWLTLHLCSSRADFDVVFVSLKAAGTPARRTLVRRTAAGHYRAQVDANWLLPGQRAHLVALDESGRRRNVHVSAAGLPSGPAMTMTTTPGGRLRLVPVQTPVLPAQAGEQVAAQAAGR